jgi:hypothetical protein
MTQLKSRAHNVPACFRFVDPENAFDRVDGSEFCDIMVDRGFHQYLTGSKQTLYSHTQMLISEQRVRDDSCVTHIACYKTDCSIRLFLITHFIE